MHGEIEFPGAPPRDDFNDRVLIWRPHNVKLAPVN